MTAQACERLILDGEETSMAFCAPILEDHPGVVELSFGEIRKRSHPSAIGSTACWRGYIGTWEIRDGLFYCCSARWLRVIVCLL